MLLRFLNNQLSMRKSLRRMTVKLLEGARDKGLQNPLVMTSLCILWMTHPLLLVRHMHLQMQMIGKKLSNVRWSRFNPMVRGNSLNDPMVANMWVANGCSRRSLGLMVLLRSTRLGLWPKVTHKKKANIFLTHIHLLLG